MNNLKQRKYLGILLIVMLVLGIFGLVKFFNIDKYKGLVKIKSVTSNPVVFSASINNIVDQPNESKGSDEIRYEIKYTLDEISGVEKRDIIVRASLSDEENKYVRFKKIKGTGITSTILNGGKEIEVEIKDAPLGVENVITLKVVITNAPNGFRIKPNIKIMEKTSSEETIVSTTSIVVNTKSIEGIVYDEYNLPLSNIELSLNDENGEIKRTYTDENGKYIFSDIDNKQYTIKIEEEIYQLVGNNVITDEGVLDLKVKEVKPYDIETHKYITKLDLIINGKSEHYEYKDLETVVQSVKNAKTIGGQITYKISIKNIGDKAGRLSILKDKVDAGLSFDNNKNPGWVLKDGNLYYEPINSVSINSGETRNVVLILDIKNTNEIKTYINEIDVNGETFERVIYILDGEKYREENVILGEKITEPIIEDDTFSGWYTDTNLTNKYKFSNPVTKDLILYGTTEVIKHKVEFYDKDPETNVMNKWDEQEVIDGRKAVKPADPSHRGYKFECWMDEHDNVWNFSNPVSRDLRLTSCYTINRYNVIFMNGDEVYDRQQVNYKENIVSPTNPTKQYYTFKYWHLYGYNESYDLTTPVVSDITLHAKFERNKHTITFVDKHPSTHEEVSRNVVQINEGEKITESIEPSKKGYNFECWSKANGECYDFNNPVLSDEELISKYSIVVYTIKYNGLTNTEKTNLNNPTSYTVEDEFTLNNPENRLDSDGDLSEIFVGWTGSNGENPSSIINIIKGTTGNKEYTASFIEAEPNVYPITYNLNGGSLDDGKINPSSYTKKTNDFTLNNPKKRGYNFTGWSGTDLIGSDNLVVTVPKGSRGARNYEAFYTPKDYTIDYENTCGVVTNPSTYTIESETFILNNPSKEGYTFTGWKTEDDETKVLNVTIEKGSIGNKKYIATCEPILYHITYNLNGGSLEEGKTNPSTYTIESDDIELNNPTKKHYTFVGWTGSNGENPETTIVIPKGSIGDKNFTANYEIIKHNVTFKDKDPENPIEETTTDFGTPLEINDGEKVTKPTSNPEHTGYTCDKWSTKLDGNYDEDAFDFNNTITNDITLYTLCKKNSYTVTFMDGLDQYAKENVLYKEFAIKPIPDPNHSSENKIFLNWLLNDSIFDFTTPITNNIVLHTSYETVEEPVISHTPTEWTNQDVTVTVSNKGTEGKDYTGYTYKYREDDESKDYNDVFTVSENKDIYATAFKSGVSSVEVKHEIRNIDKIKPIINSIDYNTVTTDSFIIDISSIDNESGLNTINIYNGDTVIKTVNITNDYNDEHSESILVDGLEPNTTYTIGVTSKDRAGNISDKETIDITTSDVDRIVAEIIAYNNVPFDSADYIPLRTLRMGIEYNQNGIDCTTNQCTIQMLENVTESNEILDGQDITLNLNGKTITGVRDYTFNNNGKFKVIDTTEENSYDIYDTSNYVKDGLGLFLDGINHGHTSGKWQDLASNNSYNIVSANWNGTGNGLVFDGTSKYVPIGEMNPEVFTFEILLEDNDVSSSSEQIFGGNLQAGGYAIFVKNGNLSVDINDGSWVVVSKPIVNNQKYLATMTYDGSSISLYVDGQLVATKPAGNIVFPTNSTQLMLGTNPNGNQPGGGYANGTIYTARLYNRVLTPEEIAKNYNNDYNRYIRTSSGSTSDTTDPGAIINTTDTAILNSGILNLGINDTTLNVSDTQPYIEGVNYGVKTDGTFNFYDGKIKALNSIKGRVYDTPEGYNANAVISEEGGVDYQIATLKILADVEARIDYVYYTRISGAVSEAKDNTNNGMTSTSEFGKGFITPGAYGFILDEENNIIVSTNNVEKTEAFSYTTIDLTESSTDKEFYISGLIDSSNLNDEGKTIENGTISIKKGNNRGNQIQYCTFNSTSSTVCSVTLEAGNKYYVELTFNNSVETDSTTSTNSRFVINEMSLKEIEMQPASDEYVSKVTIDDPIYSFDYDSSTKTFKSNNSYVNGSTAHSYYELDLTTAPLDEKLIVRASLDTLSSQNIGSVIISENSNINYNKYDTYNNFIKMQLKADESGFIGPLNFTKTLTKGKKYYLHIFYYKDNDTYTQEDYENAGVSDKFIINSIDLVGLTSGTEDLTNNFKSYEGTAFSRYEYSPYYYYGNMNENKLVDSFVMIDMRDKTSDAYVNLNAYLNYYGSGSVAPKYIYLSTNPGNADINTIRSNKEKTILYNEYNNGYIYKDGYDQNNNQSDYGVYLPKGTVYYLHFGQYGLNGNPNDTARIYSINLTYVNENYFKLGKNVNLFETTFDGEIGQGTGDTDNYVVDDKTVDKNFRFIGRNANNYVDFNGTKWRIIGVFNTKDREGNEDRRLKLISYYYDNYLSWDSSPQVESGGTSPGNTNWGNGINEWSQSDIMKIMNPGYENNEEETFYMSGSTPISNGTKLVNNSLMWTASDQTSGYNYGNYFSGTNNTTYSSSFYASNSLNAAIKPFIDEVVWYTGAYINHPASVSQTVIDMYNVERGSYTGKTGYTKDSYAPGDDVERTTSWIGKVGLPYPSDYYMASGSISGLSRESCMSHAGTCQSCISSNNWMYSGSSYSSMWFISPSNGFSGENNGSPYYVTKAYGNGMSISNAASTNPAYPTVYLNPKTKIVSGTGTYSDPFKLELGEEKNELKNYGLDGETEHTPVVPTTDLEIEGTAYTAFKTIELYDFSFDESNSTYISENAGKKYSKAERIEKIDLTNATEDLSASININYSSPGNSMGYVLLSESIKTSYDDISGPVVDAEDPMTVYFTVMRSGAYNQLEQKDFVLEKGKVYYLQMKYYKKNNEPISTDYTDTLKVKFGIKNYTSSTSEYQNHDSNYVDLNSTDTVTLVRNITTNYTVTVPETKAMTLDLNGYTLTNSASGYTIENNGSLSIIDTKFNDDKDASDMDYERRAAINQTKYEEKMEIYNQHKDDDLGFTPDYTKFTSSTCYSYQTCLVGYNSYIDGVAGDYKGNITGVATYSIPFVSTYGLETISFDYYARYAYYSGSTKVTFGVKKNGSNNYYKSSVKTATSSTDTGSLSFLLDTPGSYTLVVTVVANANYTTTFNITNLSFEIAEPTLTPTNRVEPTHFGKVRGTTTSTINNKLGAYLEVKQGVVEIAKAGSGTGDNSRLAAINNDGVVKVGEDGKIIANANYTIGIKNNSTGDILPGKGQFESRTSSYPILANSSRNKKIKGYTFVGGTFSHKNSAALELSDITFKGFPITPVYYYSDSPITIINSNITGNGSSTYGLYLTESSTYGSNNIGSITFINTDFNNVQNAVYITYARNRKISMKNMDIDTPVYVSAAGNYGREFSLNLDNSKNNTVSFNAQYGSLNIDKNSNINQVNITNGSISIDDSKINNACLFISNTPYIRNSEITNLNNRAGSAYGTNIFNSKITNLINNNSSSSYCSGVSGGSNSTYPLVIENSEINSVYNDRPLTAKENTKIESFRNYNTARINDSEVQLFNNNGAKSGSYYYNPVLYANNAKFDSLTNVGYAKNATSTATLRGDTVVNSKINSNKYSTLTLGTNDGTINNNLIINGGIDASDPDKYSVFNYYDGKLIGTLDETLIGGINDIATDHDILSTVSGDTETITLNPIGEEPEDVYVASIGGTNYTSLQTAFDAVPDGDTATTITLLRDIKTAVSATLNENKKVVLDVAGHKIWNHSKVNESIINIGDISFANSDINDNYSRSYGAGILNNAGIADFNNIVVARFYNNYPLLVNTGTMTINGGEVNSLTPNGTRNGDMINNSGNLTINSGSFIGCNSNGGSNPNVSDITNTNNLTINGGTFTNSYSLVSSGTSETGANLIVTDGTFNINGIAFKNYGTTSITGGIYSENVTLLNNNGNSDVTSTALIDGITSNLRGLATTTSNATTTIKDSSFPNLTLSSTINGNIIIDNSTINNITTMFYTTGNVTIKDSTLTAPTVISGSGNLNSENSELSSSGITVNLTSGEHINIKDGKVYSENSDAIKTGVDVVTLGVKGDEDDQGNLKLSTTNPEISGKTYGINITGSNSQIHFYDGVFKGQNAIAGSVSDVEDGYEVILESDVRGEAKFLGVRPVIRNLTTNQDYYEIQLAVDESNPGDTLQLLREVTLRASADTITIGDTKDVTIDLAGFKLIHSNPKLFVNNGTLKLTNSNTTVGTNQDGTIKISGEGCIYNSGASVIIDNNETLVVEEILIMDTTPGVIIDNSGDLTVKNAILQDNVGGEVIINSEQARIQNSIITDKVDQDVSYSHLTKFIKNSKTLTVTDSEFYGKGILLNEGSTSTATFTDVIVKIPTEIRTYGDSRLSHFEFIEFDNEGTLNLNNITASSSVIKSRPFINNNGTVNIDTMGLYQINTNNLLINKGEMNVKDLSVNFVLYGTNRLFYNTGTLSADNVSGYLAMLIDNRGTAEIVNSNIQGTTHNKSGDNNIFTYNAENASLSFEDSTLTVGHFEKSQNNDNIINFGTLSFLRTDFTTARSGNYTEKRSGIYSSGAGSSVTIDGGTFNAEIERFMYLVNSTATISNATINGYEGIITELRSQSTTNVTLNNNTISTDAFAIAERNASTVDKYYEYGEYNSSSTPSSYLGTSITINGGTYTSQNNYENSSYTYLRPPVIMMCGGNLTINDGTFTGSVQSYGSNMNLRSGTYTPNKRSYGVELYPKNTSNLNIGKKGDLDTNNNLKVSDQLPLIEKLSVYGRKNLERILNYSSMGYRISTVNFYDGRVQMTNGNFVLGDVVEIEDGYNIVCSEENDLDYCYPSNAGIIENTSTGNKYNSFTDAISNAASGDTLKVVGTGSGRSTIVMNSNGVSGTTINSGETYFIDLNNYSINMLNPFVTNNGTLNIDDTSTNKNGTILYSNISNNGTLNINNGTLEVDNNGITNVDNHAFVTIDNNNSSQLNISNGTVELNSNKSTVTQTGGKLTASSNSGTGSINTSAGEIIIGSNSGNITITGGTVSITSNPTTGYVNGSNRGTISITNATIDQLPYNYSGGIINIDHSSGKMNSRNSGGNVTITDSTITATITNTSGSTTLNNNIFENASFIKSEGGTTTLSNSSGTFTSNVVNVTGGDVTILNGTYETTASNGIQVSGGTVTLGVEDGSVSTNIPKITAANYGIYQSSGSVKFFDGRVGGKTASIFGAVSKTELGYKIVNTTIDDVIYGVLSIDETVPRVAMVNGVNYYTLQSAINACVEGETTDVILYANIILDDNIIVGDNKVVDLYLNNFTIDYGSYAFTGNGTVNIISGEPSGLGGAIYKFLANVTGSPINPIDITLYQMEDGSNLLPENTYKLYRIDGNDYKIVKVEENEIGDYTTGNKIDNLRTVSGTININNLGNGNYKLIGSDGKELEFEITTNGISSNIAKNVYGSKAKIKSKSVATLILQLQTGIIRSPYSLIIIILITISILLILKKYKKKEN